METSSIKQIAYLGGGHATMEAMENLTCPRLTSRDLVLAYVCEIWLGFEIYISHQLPLEIQKVDLLFHIQCNM